MNIAINTLSLYKTKAGMGRYIRELVNRLPALDPQHTYYLYISQKNKKYFNFEEKNVVVKTLSRFWSVHFLKLLWEQFFLPFSLWKHDIQLYHSTGFTLPFFKQKKTKYVVTIADMTFFSHPEYHLWWKVLYFRYMIPRALKKADTIITISDNTKNDILKMTNIPPEKIKTIYLGVDRQFSPLNRSVCKKIGEKYNIKTPYILFVGMLEPRKNIIGLLHAYALLKDKKGHELVIVGKKGWKCDEIFDTVKELGLQTVVRFLGYVPDEDLPALYSAATCFVYPSFYEGFGIPILEAMACGCPVITSNNSSMKEIAGNAALLIDPANKEEIKEAMELILSHKKEQQRRRRAGLLQVKKFCWETMAKQTKELYASLLH